MTKRKDDTRLALLYTENRDEQYFRPQLIVVRIEGGSRIRNVMDRNINGWPMLNDLMIDALGCKDERDRGVCAYALSYRQPYSVGLAGAKAMYTTLNRIHKTMARTYDVRGPVKTFGEYAGRVAEALRIETIIFYADDQRITSSYDDNHFRFESLGDGIRAIDWMIERWQSKYREAVNS